MNANGEFPTMCGGDPIGSALNEPKTGLPVGLWFWNSECWAYRGTLPAVLELENTLDPSTPKVRVMHVSRCPACERARYEHKRVIRWLILPL